MMKPTPAVLWAALSFSGLFAQGPLSPNTWTTGTPMPTTREGVITGVIGTKIYVIGGANNATVLNVNEVYDTVTDSWSTAAPMPTGRWNAASAVVNNILYVMGGGGNGTQLNVVEAFDPASNTWSTKAAMPITDQGIYAVVVNNIIYTLGGCCTSSGGRLANVLSYDPAKNAWSVLAPLKVGKSQSAVGVVNSLIVSAGGLLPGATATNDYEGYDIKSNTWSPLPALPVARHAGCFETAGSRLYFAGGHSIGNGNPLATMDAYDGAQNLWLTGFPSMPHAAVNIGSASVGGRLYCFGGSNAGNPYAGTIFNYTQIYQPDLPPTISAGGLVSASAFGQFTSVAPGSWIEIYGSGLSNTTRGWTLADFTGLTAPTSLDGVSVSIGGRPVFIDYVNPGQINALLPSDTPLGVQQLIVTNGAKTSAAYPVTVNATQAGLLAPPSFNIAGVQYAVAILTDGAYALPTGALAGVNSRPARPGDVLTLYGVGFGPVSPTIPAGQLAQQLTTLALPFQMNIGGVPVGLLYYGLAPNFTGLYQFNITVPSVPAGSAALTFTINGVSGTQVLSLPIAQ